jgi:putative oxidoreductase
VNFFGDGLSTGDGVPITGKTPSRFKLWLYSEVLLFRSDKRRMAMSQMFRGPLTVLGRLLLCAIFLMAAVGNKIPHFSYVAKVMESVGVPAPQLLLVGAIVFLIVGSLSVIAGYKARIGAALLLTFLVLASYYFHAFWNVEGQAQQEPMIHFMKNLSMMGAMLFIVANGSGPISLDSRSHKRVTASVDGRRSLAQANVA